MRPGKHRSRAGCPQTGQRRSHRKLPQQHRIHAAGQLLDQFLQPRLKRRFPLRTEQRNQFLGQALLRFHRFAELGGGAMQVIVRIPQSSRHRGDNPDAPPLFQRLLHYRAVRGHHRNVHQIFSRFHHRREYRAGQADGIGPIFRPVANQLAHPAAQRRRNPAGKVHKQPLVQQVDYLRLGKLLAKRHPHRRHGLGQSMNHHNTHQSPETRPPHRRDGAKR